MYQALRFPLCLGVFVGLLLNSRSLSAQAVYDQLEQDFKDPIPASQPGLLASAPSEGAPIVSTNTLPLRRLTLFSSGLGFFEHQGPIAGSAVLTLPFKAVEVNDVLKSLVIEDPASSPRVVYPSEQTLSRTLKSLSIDLSRYSSIPEILDSLKGAEIQVHSPLPLQGRILGVEYRATAASPTQGAGKEPYLSLYTDQGIRLVRFTELGSFAFLDPLINADLTRALDLIMHSRNEDTRNLQIQLPGAGQREVSLSYVIPTPVWKVSYRLDLSQDRPLLQGWAIVDNDSDLDWNNLELALVSGRQVSFIQNLYPPYHLRRPVLPLAIPGIAEAQTYDSGWTESAGGAAAVALDETALPPSPEAAQSLFQMEKRLAPAPRAANAQVLGTSPLESAQAQSRGEQFAFTLPEPVSLARQQSAMLPLVEAAVNAVKTLVFSGAKALKGGAVHPALSAELTNTTGLPLPPGPITVYDGGTYGGDSLFEFFPEQEKRLISYGDELAVTGYVRQRSSRVISAVTVRQGIMTINRKLIYETRYTWINASGTARRLILEHPFTRETSLTEPAAFDSRTDTLYRFVTTLPSGQDLSMTVTEEQALAEQIILTQLNLPSFISYTRNQEIPEQVRSALQRGIELKQAADAAQQALATLNTQRERLIAEQDRIRRNLEAAGNQTQQGQEYLKRLLAQDAAIDDLYSRLEGAEKTAQDAQVAYDTYISSLKL